MEKNGHISLNQTDYFQSDENHHINPAVMGSANYEAWNTFLSFINNNL